MNPLLACCIVQLCRVFLAVAVMAVASFVGCLGAATLLGAFGVSVFLGEQFMYVLLIGSVAGVGYGGYYSTASITPRSLKYAGLAGVALGVAFTIVVRSADPGLKLAFVAVPTIVAVIGGVIALLVRRPPSKALERSRDR